MHSLGSPKSIGNDGWTLGDEHTSLIAEPSLQYGIGILSTIRGCDKTIAVRVRYDRLRQRPSKVIINITSWERISFPSLIQFQDVRGRSSSVLRPLHFAATRGERPRKRLIGLFSKKQNSSVA